MKKIFCFMLPVLMLAAAAFAGQDEFKGRHGGSGGVQNSRGEAGRQARGGVAEAIQNYRLSRPEALERNNIVNDDRRIAAPQRYNNGQAVRAKAVSAPPARHWEIAGNKDMLSGINRERPGERRAGQYYWHNAGGRRYAHYYDDHGLDWYGFYFGSSFYWTRYYADRWWWYDDSYARWVFWWNNNWWWQGPGGTAYVYLNDNYYPSRDGAAPVAVSSVTAPTATVPAAPAAPAAVPTETAQWSDPGGTRLVKLLGGDHEAFLYGLDGDKQVFISYLGKGVQKVRFSAGKDGKTLVILVDYTDGTFAVLDENGQTMK